MLVHWIWLATRPDLPDREKVTLLERFHDPEVLYYADEAVLCQVESLGKKARESLMDKELGPAEHILTQCSLDNIHLLTYADGAYPARLKNIPDPPVVLYYKGRLPDIDGNPVIGVVGTRRASAYGLGVAKRMGYQIASCGGIVVSGMAFGIDGLSMQGALTAGMPVIGILGTGADVVYPVSNRALFADVEQRGCLLTEFPPGTPPMKWNFPKRNRLISGLSCGVLIVEAPEKSGALITARLALDQGRDVFAVPGNIDVATCVGSNALLRDGAIAATRGWDVVGEYEALFPGKIRRDLRGAHQAAYPEEIRQTAGPLLVAEERVLPEPEKPQKRRKKIGKKKKTPVADKKDVDNESKAPYSDSNEKFQSLSQTERQIVQAIGSGTCLVDAVIAGSGLSTGVVLSTLTILEVKGIVVRLPGKQVRLAERF